MNDATLTHKDLAELLDVSETTVKSYRRKFPGCFPVASRGKPIRFTPESGDVARRIHDFFALGMSVGEVRLRLVQEFSWIAADNAERCPPPRRDASGVSPELTQGVSNMAKSMVAIAQQQKNLLTRMRGIEAMLEELGLQGPVDADALRRAAAEGVQKKEAYVEARLNRLDAASQELAATLSSLARDWGRFLARQEQAGGSPQTAAEHAAPLEQAGAKVIPLRQESDVLHPQAFTPASVETRAAEPPRQFFTLPLVVRTGQGHYISAGGRSRGRFCLNDLKAMLAYAFIPPHHFTLKWEALDRGWRLILAQALSPDKDTEGSTRTYRLRLMELPTQKGNAVVEILELQSGDEPMHPVEICTLINSFGE